MAENTPAKPEAGSGPGDPTPAQGTVDPNAATPADPVQSAEARQTPDPTLVHRYKKQLADKERYIGQLRSELGEVRVQQDETRRAIEEMRARGNDPRGPDDPVASEFTKAFDDLDGKRFASALDSRVAQTVEQAIGKALPSVMRAEQVRRETAQGFEHLRGMGVDAPPDELRLDQAAARLSPEQAYLAKLMQEEGVEAAHKFLGDRVKRQDSDRRKAEILSTIAEGRPLGPEVLAAFGSPSGAPGIAPNQKGYAEGEHPNLMYELSKAPDKRIVPDDRWTSDDGI